MKAERGLASYQHRTKCGAAEQHFGLEGRQQAQENPYVVVARRATKTFVRKTPDPHLVGKHVEVGYSPSSEPCYLVQQTACFSYSRSTITARRQDIGGGRVKHTFEGGYQCAGETATTCSSSIVAAVMIMDHPSADWSISTALCSLNMIRCSPAFTYIQNWVVLLGRTEVLGLTQKLPIPHHA